MKRPAVWSHLAQVAIGVQGFLQVCREIDSDAERFISAPAVSYSLPPLGLLIWKPAGGRSLIQPSIWALCSLVLERIESCGIDQRGMRGVCVLAGLDPTYCYQKRMNSPAEIREKDRGRVCSIIINIQFKLHIWSASHMKHGALVPKIINKTMENRVLRKVPENLF